MSTELMALAFAGCPRSGKVFMEPSALEFFRFSHNLWENKYGKSRIFRAEIWYFHVRSLARNLHQGNMPLGVHLDILHEDDYFFGS